MDRRLPRSSGITRGPPLIRHTIGDSIRKYQVRIQVRGEPARGDDGVGGRGIGEFGHGLSITNPPVEFCPINLCSFPRLLPLRARRPSLRPLYSVRYLPIYLSIGWMSECTNQALMHAKRRAEKLIVIHVRRLSHAFSTRWCPVRLAAGKINSRVDWEREEGRGAYRQSRLLLVNTSKESS